MSDNAATFGSGTTLVTGAAGHVGANLMHRLLRDGHTVRVLAQPGANNRAFDGVDVQVVHGDFRDRADCLRALDGCSHLFHVAAKVSTLNATAGELREIYDVNVLGTRNIMRAALEVGVERAVLTGSFSAVGYDVDNTSNPSNEDMPFYPFGNVLPYARSKAQAEHETLKVVVDGLDAVIATSCACIGPYDYLPSRMGRTMCDFMRGKLRAYIPGGFPFVAADDLVQGHMLAMTKGRTGHKYIFATEFMTLDDLVVHFSEITGRPPPRLRLPAAVMATITGLYSGTFAKYFPGVPQRLTPGAINILRMRRHADLSKAKDELGYEPGSIRDAIRQAFEFFIREGMIDAELPEAPPPDPQQRAAAAE